MKRILLTGSRGKLGKYLTQKSPNIIGNRLNIDEKLEPMGRHYDLVIHAAALTHVANAELEPEKYFKTNVYGTFNLVEACKDIPFVFISTEYAHKPLGVYAKTKWLGEQIVKMHPNHLIIRTLFKPTPWELDVAYTDQYTDGDYVDVIADLIWKEIQEWDRTRSKHIYVGTGRKSMYELAIRTRPDVKPNKVTNPVIPKDYL